jgi:hypothetical protein
VHLDRGERAHDHTEHGGDDGLPGASASTAGAQTASCPACGARGALTLGGSSFCPTCGEVTTSPGYRAPLAGPASPGPGSGED